MAENGGLCSELSGCLLIINGRNKNNVILPTPNLACVTTSNPGNESLFPFLVGFQDFTEFPPPPSHLSHSFSSEREACQCCPVFHRNLQPRFQSSLHCENNKVLGLPDSFMAVIGFYTCMSCVCSLIILYHMQLLTHNFLEMENQPKMSFEPLALWRYF